MIDIQKEIAYRLISESRKAQHIFNNDSLTFKQLKDVFTDVFGSYIVKVSRKVPMAAVYVTNKDGNFFISSVDRPSKLLKVDALKNVAKLDESACKPASATMKDVVDVLSQIDPVKLNRYFANGKNMLKCYLVCPPDGCGSFYGDKCLVQFDGIDCFDSKCKNIGRDEECSVEVLDALKSNDALSNEFASINAEQLNVLKRCRSEKNVLENIINALKKLIDGIGWGCSIKYYIQDRYARSIVNKALEHGLDVSKNGAFVDELAARLSGTSAARPTKSDLVTFAKREGIDSKSQEYKDFLDDVESSAEETSRQIISPIENVMYYALSKAANNALALMALDPNPKAKKLLSQIATSVFDTCDSIDNCGFDASQIESLKKSLQKICSYNDFAPSEIRVMNGGKPYQIESSLKNLQKLYEVVQ